MLNDNLKHDEFIYNYLNTHLKDYSKNILQKFHYVKDIK